MKFSFIINKLFVFFLIAIFIIPLNHYQSSADSINSITGVGQSPFGVALDPLDGKIYVTNSASDSISVISSSSNTVVHTISVGLGTQPTGIAFDAENGDIYVATPGDSVFNPGSVEIIDGNPSDTTYDTVIQTISRIGDQPVGVAYDPYNMNMYVTIDSDDRVIKIFSTTNTYNIIQVGSVTETEGYGVAFNSADDNMYVDDTGSNQVAVIDYSNQILTKITVGNHPSAIAYDSHNKDVYVANYNDNTVSVIDGNPSDTTYDIVIQTINVGTSPAGIAFDAQNNQIYVTNSGQNGLDLAGTVSIISDSNNQVTATDNVGNDPQGILYDGSNQNIYAAAAGAVYIISDSTTCTPPTSGDWTVASSCTVTASATAPANVIVQPGAVLTIPSGLKLTIDFTHYHLLVNAGGGVLINAGGAIN